jgi:hypothetical protein
MRRRASGERALGREASGRGHAGSGSASGNGRVSPSHRRTIPQTRRATPQPPSGQRHTVDAPNTGMRRLGHWTLTLLELYRPVYET